MPVTKIQALDERVLPFAPGQIWAVLADTGSYPAWYPPSVRIKVLAAAANVVGTEFEIQPRGGRSFRCHITSAEPPHRIRLRYAGGFIEGTGEWRLEPAANGTQVAYEMDVGAKGWLVAMLGRVLPLAGMHSRAMKEILFSLENEAARRVA